MGKILEVIPPSPLPSPGFEPLYLCAELIELSAPYLPQLFSTEAYLGHGRNKIPITISPGRFTKPTKVSLADHDPMIMRKASIFPFAHVQGNNISLCPCARQQYFPLPKSKAKIQGNEGMSVHHSKLRNDWEQTLTGFVIMIVIRSGEILIRSGEIVIGKFSSAMS